MTTIPNRLATTKKKLTPRDLEGLTLLYGAHPDRAQGLCALEAVAWLAGEEHSDRPACACPVVAAFARRLNDRIGDDAERTRILRPLIPRIVGTRSTEEVERRRAYVAADWACRDAAPRALEARAVMWQQRGDAERADKLRAHAKHLRELPEVVDKATARAAEKVASAANAAAGYAAANAADANAADAYAAAGYAAANAADAYAAAYAAAHAAAYAAYAAYAAARVEVWESAAACLVRMIEVAP